QRPSTKPREPVHCQARASTEHQRDAGRHHGDFEAGQRGGAELVVLQQDAIPARRPPAPDRHQPRGVERIGDEDGDRQVKKAEAERQRAETKDSAAAPTHHAARSARRCATRSGSVTTATSATATAEAAGQSTLSKNSCHNSLPIISVSGPPRRSGMTNSPTAGMKTKSMPAATPGKVSGRTTPRNTCHGVAPRSAAASTRVSSSRDRLP